MTYVVFPLDSPAMCYSERICYFISLFVFQQRNKCLAFLPDMLGLRRKDKPENSKIAISPYLAHFLGAIKGDQSPAHTNMQIPRSTSIYTTTLPNHTYYSSVLECILQREAPIRVKEPQQFPLYC